MPTRAKGCDILRVPPCCHPDGRTAQRHITPYLLSRTVHRHRCRRLPDPTRPARSSALLLINIGSLVYRHGSGEAPSPQSEPVLGYTEKDVYEDGMLVAGNLLDVRRDLAEIGSLADLCAAEPS